MIQTSQLSESSENLLHYEFYDQRFVQVSETSGSS